MASGSNATSDARVAPDGARLLLLRLQCLKRRGDQDAKAGNFRDAVDRCGWHAAEPGPLHNKPSQPCDAAGTRRL